MPPTSEQNDIEETANLRVTVFPEGKTDAEGTIEKEEIKDSINAPSYLGLRKNQRPVEIMDQLEKIDPDGAAIYQFDQRTPYRDGYIQFLRLSETKDPKYEPVRIMIDMYREIESKFKDTTDQIQKVYLGQIKQLLLDVLECQRTQFTVQKFIQGDTEVIDLYMDVYGKRGSVPDLTLEKRSNGNKIIHFRNTGGSDMYWYYENSQGARFSISTPISSGLFSLKLTYRTDNPGEKLGLINISGGLNDWNLWTAEQAALVFDRAGLDEAQVDFDKELIEILTRWPYNVSQIKIPPYRFEKKDLIFKHDFSYFHGDSQRDLPSRSFHTVLLENDGDDLIAVNFDTHTGYPFETTIQIDKVGETPVETMTGKSMGTTISGKVIVNNGHKTVEIPLEEIVLLSSNNYYFKEPVHLATALAKKAYELDPSMVPDPPERIRQL